MTILHNMLHIKSNSVADTTAQLIKTEQSTISFALYYASNLFISPHKLTTTIINYHNLQKLAYCLELQKNSAEVARPPHHHTTTVLRPFFQDYPGEPLPEENFWTLWCKGRLIEADTLIIRLGATPS